MANASRVLLMVSAVGLLVTAVVLLFKNNGSTLTVIPIIGAAILLGFGYFLFDTKVGESQGSTGLKDGVLTGTCEVDSIPMALAVMDFRFMGGSMGSVVGEKITRLIEHSTKEKLPLLIVCASGGARMQEGMLSLMQMAKISGALERHRDAQLLYMPLLTHPTTGGVTASFAMLGDLILAEPKALIGFAGRRVIEQTLREKLPDNFQTAEYLQDHGFCLLYTSPSPRDATLSRMPSSA